MFRNLNWRVAAIALLFVSAVTARADNNDNRFELKFSRTLTYHGGKITLDNKFGDVVVRTGGGSQFNVKATIRSSDPDFGQQIHIDVSDAAGGITVRTRYPESRM